MQRSGRADVYSYIESVPRCAARSAQFDANFHTANEQINAQNTHARMYTGRSQYVEIQ